MSVRNYPAEFLEIFRQASKEPIRIELETLKDAQRLRFRLNNLKADMRKENHRLLSVAESTQNSLEPSGGKDDPAALIVHPCDDKFLPAIRAAGISIPEDEAAADYTEPEFPEPEAPTPLRHSPDAGLEAINKFLDAKE